MTPPLPPPNGQLGDGALPRHPRRERRDLVQRHAGVIPDTALRRAERDVVLDAVAGEDLDLAVVHQNRARHRDLSLGVGEDLPDARVEIEDARRAVELLQHCPEHGSVVRHASFLPRSEVGVACTPSSDTKLPLDLGLPRGPTRSPKHPDIITRDEDRRRAHRTGVPHDFWTRDRGPVHGTRGRIASRSGSISLYARHPRQRLPRQALDDAPVCGLRHPGRHQPAIPRPARSRRYRVERGL